MSKDELGDRQKGYEDSYRLKLPNRMPIILRLDGRSFSRYTSKLDKPFDKRFVECMDDLCKYLCNNIQGAKLVYTQSDEISILIYNPSFEGQGWFENNLQKIVSVSAGMASAYFSILSPKLFGQTKLAQFDARAFVVPNDEVVNAFEWRQQDSIRNSVQSLARSVFSHKECHKKNGKELKEMCSKIGVHWNDLPIHLQRGRCVVKSVVKKMAFNKYSNKEYELIRPEWIIDYSIPIFHEDRKYIDRHLVDVLDSSK